MTSFFTHKSGRGLPLAFASCTVGLMFWHTCCVALTQAIFFNGQCDTSLTSIRNKLIRKNSCVFASRALTGAVARHAQYRPSV